MTDDLINRADTFDVLTDYYHIKTEAQLAKLAEAISRVPSAERRGKWIESNLIPSRKGKPGGRLFICSECNKGWIKQDRSIEGVNFCPNCGARMERSRR